MTFHPYSPFIPPAISLLAIALTGWNLWRIRYAHRAHGRRAVEQILTRRGETLVALRDVPFNHVRVRTGLSSTVVFAVRARTPDGDEYYFGADNVTGVPFEHLQVGTQVQFIPEVAALGRQAKRVSVGKHGAG